MCYTLNIRYLVYRKDGIHLRIESSHDIAHICHRIFDSSRQRKGLKGTDGMDIAKGKATRRALLDAGCGFEFI